MITLGIAMLALITITMIVVTTMRNNKDCIDDTSIWKERREMKKNNEKWLDITEDIELDGPKTWGCSEVYGIKLSYEGEQIGEICEGGPIIHEDKEKDYRVLQNFDGYLGFRIEKKGE